MSEPQNLIHWHNMYLRLIQAAVVVGLVQVSSVSAQQPFDWQQFVPQAGGPQQSQFLPRFFGELSKEEMEKLEAVEVTPADERSYGRGVVRKLEQSLQVRQIRLSRKGEDIDYLEKLVTLARSKMEHGERYEQIQLAIIDYAVEDAYSIPGGHLYFTRGLLDNIESEAALMAVICHELSHLDRGHQLLGLRQLKQNRQSRRFFDQLTSAALQFRPHPEFEKQADEDAVKRMLELNYDPREFAHLMDRWEQRQSTQAPWVDFVPSAFKSHPDAGLRVQHILELFAKYEGDRNKLLIGRENLKQRVPCAERLFP